MILYVELTRATLARSRATRSSSSLNLKLTRETRLSPSRAYGKIFVQLCSLGRQWYLCHDN